MTKQEHIDWLYAERRKAMCKIVNDPTRLTGNLAPLREHLADAIAEIDTYTSARCTTEKPNELAHLETASE